MPDDNDALRKILDALTSLGDRMDSIEKRTEKQLNGGATMVAADSALSIAGELQHVETLKAELRRRQKNLDTVMREARPPTEEEEAGHANFQARADSVYAGLGGGRPVPFPLEHPRLYRARVLGNLKKYSPKWREAGDLSSFPENALDTIEKEIFADAMTEARRPTQMPPGELRMITRNEGGHTVNEFFSSRGTFISQIKPQVMQARITDPREIKLRQLLDKNPGILN